MTASDINCDGKFFRGSTREFAFEVEGDAELEGFRGGDSGVHLCREELEDPVAMEVAEVLVGSRDSEDAC